MLQQKCKPKPLNKVFHCSRNPPRIGRCVAETKRLTTNMLMVSTSSTGFAVIAGLIISIVNDGVVQGDGRAGAVERCCVQRRHQTPNTKGLHV